MSEPLSSERWNKIERLFEQAADLPPDARALFLDAECAGDSQMRQEIVSLLRYGDQGEAEPPEWMEALQAGAASVLTEESMVGRRLGAYRIESELGRGGMGVVYLATRADGNFQKQVAIKLVKRGMDTAAVVERLRRERRILAELEHPSIAGLLDGGTTPEGLPYIVMEYVEGLPIVRFCEERGLPLRQRCELMLRVCDAVSYAHRKLVVHRDLKPANILITEAGVPKLLDFGLAKILDAEPDSGLTTAVQARPLTPAYASPEQLLGQALTTATDVYSLGVILHELLTGARPHRLHSPGPGAPAAEWARAVCETEIARPSAALTGQPGRERWRKQVEGDLDNIVMMAMRREPERRYASVDELANDIRRYLQSRPVLARQDSLAYRAQKFVRRQRFALLAGAAVLLSLIGGMVIAWREADRAEAARRKAEDHLAVVLHLSDQSLSGVADLLERVPGAGPARRQLIGETLSSLEKLSKEAGTEERLRLTLAKAYLRLGNLQGGPDVATLEDYQGALQSYRAGAALLGGDQGPVAAHGTGEELERFATWLDLQTNSAAALYYWGDRRGARQLLGQLISRADHLSPVWLASKEIAKCRARLRLWLGRVSTGDAREALPYAYESRDALAALVPQYPEDSDLRYDLSTAETLVGWLHWLLGDLEATVPHYEQTIRLREELVKSHPSDLTYRRALALAYQHYASAQGSATEASLGRTEIARSYYTKALPIEESLAADAGNSQAAADLAELLLLRAALDVPPEGVASSLASLHRARATYEKLAAGGATVHLRGVALASEHIGRRLAALGNYAGAMAEYQHSVAISEKILSAHPEEWEALKQIFDTGRDQESILTLVSDRAAALEHARAMIRRADATPAKVPRLDTAIGRAYLAAAQVYRDFGDCTAARDAARKAIQRARPLANGRSWDRNGAVLRDAETLIAGCPAQDK